MVLPNPAISTLPSKVIIPDLVTHCPFELHRNPLVESAASQSKEWLFEHVDLNERNKNAFHGLKAGELCAMCYPTADLDRLRVCCDFMNLTFHIDDLSDDMDKIGTVGIANDIMKTLYHLDDYQPTTHLGRMTADYWKRVIKTASIGAQQRFTSTFDQALQAISIEAVDRMNGTIPGLESYIASRRDSSGCKPWFAFIKYTNNLDIPDEVMEHPIIHSLENAANDFASWCNDVFSYNREHVTDSTHNMIPVVMQNRGLDLQSAVDLVGDMCKESIDRYIANMNILPSWGPDIDRQVQIYVSGFADWMVGNLHWSFDSERYFGKSGPEVKATRIVHLYT